jgi:hypothetical protein
MTPIIKKKQDDTDIVAVCASCGGHSFRRSRLRLRDVWTLLGLCYPVRCLTCGKRRTVPLPIALRALPSKVRTVHAEQRPVDGAPPRSAPATVGDRGDNSWSLPVHEAMTMPDLRGVTLKHLASPPDVVENQKG